MVALSIVDQVLFWITRKKKIFSKHIGIFLLDVTVLAKILRNIAKLGSYAITIAVYMLI